MGKKYTAAQAKANSKYASKFAKLTIRISPEFKKEITDYCLANDISITSFITQAIRDKLD